MCYAFRTIGGRIEFDGITPDHGLNEQLVLDAHSIVGYYVGLVGLVRLTGSVKQRPVQSLLIHVHGASSPLLDFHVGELDDPLVRDTRLITDVINTLNTFIT
jgi:hypothetical protein